MSKKRTLSLADCYALLQLPKDASLDDVKRAYRRRAFELHPDLNPDTPQAGYKFQDLNEAYVSLTRILEAEEERRKAEAAVEQKRQEENARREAEREAERKAYEAEKVRMREEREKARQAKEREREEKEKERQERIRQREEAKVKAQAEAKARAEQQAKAKAEAKEAQDWQKQREEWAERVHAERQRAHKAYAKEDVLRDLLDDPFARRVFEDIYSAVNKQGSSSAEKGATADTSATTTSHSASSKAEESKESSQKKTQESVKPESAPKAEKAAPPTVEVTLNDAKSAMHMANSFSGKIMGWFKQQIDDEQTIKMPARNLFVGARIRLQIRRGLSEELSTVEITLPKEFVVGKPLRLKGLGKKVGKWQGDLYLTIESK